MLTLYGWLAMTLSVGSVLLLTTFCLVRVLMLPPKEVSEHLKAPIDIDTRDRKDPD